MLATFLHYKVAIIPFANNNYLLLLILLLFIVIVIICKGELFFLPIFLFLSVWSYRFSCSFFLVFVYLRESTHEWGEGQRRRGRERIPIRLCVVSTESNAGLRLMNHEITIWTKIKSLAYSSEPPRGCKIFIFFNELFHCYHYLGIQMVPALASRIPFKQALGPFWYALIIFLSIFIFQDISGPSSPFPTPTWNQPFLQVVLVSHSGECFRYQDVSSRYACCYWKNTDYWFFQKRANRSMLLSLCRCLCLCLSLSPTHVYLLFLLYLCIYTCHEFMLMPPIPNRHQTVYPSLPSFHIYLSHPLRMKSGSHYTQYIYLFTQF